MFKIFCYKNGDEYVDCGSTESLPKLFTICWFLMRFFPIVKVIDPTEDAVVLKFENQQQVWPAEKNLKDALLTPLEPIRVGFEFDNEWVEGILVDIQPISFGIQIDGKTDNDRYAYMLIEKVSTEISTLKLHLKAEHGC